VAIAVFRMGAVRHHRTDRGQLLQELTGSDQIGGLGRLGGNNASQVDCQPLGAFNDPVGVSIPHRTDRGNVSRMASRGPRTAGMGIAE